MGLFHDWISRLAAPSHHTSVEVSLPGSMQPGPIRTATHPCYYVEMSLIWNPISILQVSSGAEHGQDQCRDHVEPVCPGHEICHGRSVMVSIHSPPGMWSVCVCVCVCVWFVCVIDRENERDSVEWRARKRCVRQGGGGEFSMCLQMCLLYSNWFRVRQPGCLLRLQ